MDSINVSQDKGWYIYCVIEKLLAESTTEKLLSVQYSSISQSLMTMPNSPRKRGQYNVSIAF